MKIFNINNILPFISTLFIIILLSLSNQKENTNLKILICNTPKLSLGTYIAISAGTGYLLSYILTNNLAKINRKNQRKELEYKTNNQKDVNNYYEDRNHEVVYDNTLIERDINDPSPTITASFRVIGKTNRKNQKDKDFEYNDYGTTDFSDESEYQKYEQDLTYRNDLQTNTIHNDWEDDTYTKW